jgi:hypothetical protein
MESRDYIRPFLALLVGIGLIVLVIILLIKAFTGAPSAPTSNINVTNHDNTTSSATLLVDAPTGIDQDHRQVKITVSGTSNEIDIIQGYQGKVMDTQSYSNNTAAYGAFLQTLQLLNFSKGKVSSASYEGYCPSGDRYVFTFSNGNGNLFSYWATSCGGQGTYSGQVGGTLQQFMNQIPSADFTQLTNDIDINF